MIREACRGVPIVLRRVQGKKANVTSGAGAVMGRPFAKLAVISFTIAFFTGSAD
jgi:hypothetical protein